MRRIPEPELMDDEAQARAYAMADFSQPHDRFVALFGEAFPNQAISGNVLDLGCGPADVTIRFARAYGDCRIDGVDASANMLKLGTEAVRREKMEQRIRLVLGYLPAARLPLERYDAVISNSLLHHLHDPAVLWNSICRYAKSGAPILVMDLCRPVSGAELKDWVARYTVGEPELLRRDFHNSLLAAYRVEEVSEQLRTAGLENFAVRMVSERHLIVVGRA